MCDCCLMLSDQISFERWMSIERCHFLLDFAQKLQAYDWPAVNSDNIVCCRVFTHTQLTNKNESMRSMTFCFMACPRKKCGWPNWVLSLLFLGKSWIQSTFQTKGFDFTSEMTTHMKILSQFNKFSFAVFNFIWLKFEIGCTEEFKYEFNLYL